MGKLREAAKANILGFADKYNLVDALQKDSSGQYKFVCEYGFVTMNFKQPNAHNLSLIRITYIRPASEIKGDGSMWMWQVELVEALKPEDKGYAKTHKYFGKNWLNKLSDSTPFFIDKPNAL